MWSDIEVHRRPLCGWRDRCSLHRGGYAVIEEAEKETARND
jgi:hypothetical protein